MKKYLIQFCDELDASTGKVGDFTPQYVPTRGIVAEISHEKMSDLMEDVFTKFPRYHIAIVSEVNSGENDEFEFGKFQFIAVNHEWNGKKSKGYAVDMPIDMFKMMG